MESLEIHAKTVGEAVQHALAQLGVSREEVEITVVKEGKSGILGLGAEEAVVRVQRVGIPAKKETDITEVARSTLERLLALTGVAGSVELQPQFLTEEEKGSSGAIAFDIKGEDLGILIGRWGQTLSALQYIVRLIVGHQTKSLVPIALDVGGYKQRRYQALQALAERFAEQVKVRGTPFTLRPMSANERRIIHLTLADHPDVTTESIGQGEARRVVILPKE